MFIEEHGIEDFGLTWDDAKGGYMLTWTSKEKMEGELLEAKIRVKVSDVHKIKEEVKKIVGSGSTQDALYLIETFIYMFDIGDEDKAKGKVKKLYDFIMKLIDEEEDLEREYAEYVVRLLELVSFTLKFEAKDSAEGKLKESKDKEEKKETKKHELKEETKVLSSLNEFEPWSGAVSTWELIVEADKVDALDFMLEDLYPEGITSTELNDLLWFESDWVLDMLGIDESEVEAEEDKEEGKEEAEGKKPEIKDELIALNDLDEEPVVFDIDELEEGKHAHDKKEKHVGKEEMKESSGSILKEVQDFISKTVGK
jgi:hypothetical protein